MKKLTLILFLIATITFAQQDQDMIKEHFAVYEQAMIKKDFDKVLDYTHPAIFELYGRDVVKASLEMTMNGSGDMTMDFTEMKITQISDIITFEDRKITKLVTKAKMTMNFAEELDEETQGFMIKTMEAQLGEGCCNYDAATKKLSVSSISDIYAVADKNSDDWKFLSQDEQTKTILDKIIPKEIQEKLK
ncbi:MAG: hypothetical protein HRT68_00695 [Flavobacteriaceae bacterium]|nr:hypothetical protein [Flavobacteriaceae bacterium]